MAKMNTIKIEQKAIDEVKKILGEDEYLDYVIYEKDKIPLWDGYISVYKTPKLTKADFIGRIPIQIKGTQSEVKNTCSIAVSDLKAYFRDGGVIYFVNYVFKKEDEIVNNLYYANLLPVDIQYYIEGKEEQGTVSVNLEKFDKKGEKLRDFLIMFIEESKKQIGGISNQKFELNFIEGKQVNFTVYKHKGKIDNPLKTMTEQAVYVYSVPPNKLSKGIALGKVKLANKFKQSFSVGVKENIIFTDAKIGYDNGKSVIYCTDNFKLISSADFLVKELVPKVKFDFEINYDFIRVDEMFKIIEFKKLIQEEKTITIDNINFINIKSDFEKYIEMYDFWKDLKEIFEELGIKFNFSYQEFLNNYNRIIVLNYRRIPLSETNIPVNKFNQTALIPIKIADKIYVLIFVPNKENDSYKIINVLDMSISFKVILEDEKETKISRFMCLGSSAIIELEISAEDVLKDIKDLYEESDVKNYFLQYLVLSLLEYIKAYDMKKNKEIEKVIVQLSEWLDSVLKNEISFINKMQVKKRIGQIEKEEKEKLKDYLNSNENLSIKVSCLILLEEYNEAKKIVNKMKKKEKEEYLKYPIYSLLKKEELNE